MSLEKINVRKLVRDQAMRVRVTPDPKHAAELERRREKLNYYPQNGFLRDIKAERKAKWQP